MTCPNCDGHGTLFCGDCGGSGNLLMSGRRCATCQGRGDADCPWCHGAGVVESDSVEGQQERAAA